jgi:choline kinase
MTFAMTFNSFPFMGQTAADQYTAILLAAGYGSRIAGMTAEPKCLLPLSGTSLLERNLLTWKSLGIRKVVLVLGYKADTIRHVSLRHECGSEFKYVINEHYRDWANTYSMLLGLKASEGPCLVFDADLAYEAQLLQAFIDDPAGDQIFVSHTDIDDVEAAKTLVDRRGFARKTVDKRSLTSEERSSYEFAGEATGILKFSAGTTPLLTRFTEAFLAKPENLKKSWEHLLNEFLPKHEVGVHITQSRRLIEIDTPDDYAQAKEMFESP